MGTITSLRERALPEAPRELESGEAPSEEAASGSGASAEGASAPRPPRVGQGASPLGLVRLLQFSSQSMPTGGFAYSSGLEMALELGHFSDAATGAAYLSELAEHQLGGLDLPLLCRLLAAERTGDRPRARRLSAYLSACRETSELRAQDEQMGRALGRVLADLRPHLAFDVPPRTFAEAYARAAVGFGIFPTEALLGYGYSWVEQHVTALARLLALGPLGTQRVLDQALALLPRTAERAATLGDRDVGASSPGLAIASALHEEQYTRIFRS